MTEAPLQEETATAVAALAQDRALAESALKLRRVVEDYARECEAKEMAEKW